MSDQRLVCLFFFLLFSFFCFRRFFHSRGEGRGGGSITMCVWVSHTVKNMWREGERSHTFAGPYTPPHTHTHTLSPALSLSLSLSHPFFRKGGRRKKNNELDNLQSSRTEFVRLFVFARKISHLLLGSALCVFSLCGELL